MMKSTFFFMINRDQELLDLVCPLLVLDEEHVRYCCSARKHCFVDSESDRLTSGRKLDLCNIRIQNNIALK